MYRTLFVISFFILSCSPNNSGDSSKTVNDSSKIHLLPQKDTLELAEDATMSEITCPNCKFRKKEKLPTEICLLKYTCTACRTEMVPLEGDCCVFCSYGTHKCPSKQ